MSPDPAVFLAMSETLMRVLTALEPLSLAADSAPTDRSDALSGTIRSIQAFAEETLANESITGERT